MKLGRVFMDCPSVKRFRVVAEAGPFPVSPTTGLFNPLTRRPKHGWLRPSLGVTPCLKRRPINGDSRKVSK